MKDYEIRVSINKWLSNTEPAVKTVQVHSTNLATAILEVESQIMRRVKRLDSSAEFVLQKDTGVLKMILTNGTVLVPTFELV
jgi:hypothetical protein